MQTNEGLRRFHTIGKYDRTSYLQYVRRQLECEKVRLRHDIDGAGTVFAVEKKHGRQREVWHGTKLSQASLPPPRPSCLAGPETFGDIEFRPRFSCLLSADLPRTRAPFSLDDIQASRVDLRACNLKRHLDTTGDLKPDTILHPISCCWPMGEGLLVEFIRCTVRPSEMLSGRVIGAKTFFCA